MEAGGDITRGEESGVWACSMLGAGKRGKLYEVISTQTREQVVVLTWAFFFFSLSDTDTY